MPKISDDAASLVSIGQLAKAAGVSSRTIRYYEELGILPEPRRSPGGTRKYPREYGGYIAAALALKDLGFRLEEVKPLAAPGAGRSVSPGQRDAAARLVEDKIESLARQVTCCAGCTTRSAHRTAACPCLPCSAARTSPWCRRSPPTAPPELRPPPAERERIGTPPLYAVREGPGGGMSQGVILLVFIALIIAYIVTRTRRRMGMLVTARTWLIMMVAVIIGILALWASQTH